MKITNTQAGPRGINTVTGPVLVEPKQTVEAKVYAREKEHIEAAGWFTVEGSYEADPDAPKASAAAGASDDKLEAANRRIAELEGQVTAKDSEIADLKKKLPETDIEKMTVAELRGFLAFHDVAYDGTKDKKPELTEKAKAVKVA